MGSLTRQALHLYWVQRNSALLNLQKKTKGTTKS